MAQTKQRSTSRPSGKHKTSRIEGDTRSLKAQIEQLSQEIAQEETKLAANRENLEFLERVLSYTVAMRRRRSR